MCLPRPCSISLCLGPNPYSPLESVKTQNETFQRTGSKDVLFEMPHVPPHTHTATALPEAPGHDLPMWTEQGTEDP